MGLLSDVKNFFCDLFGIETKEEKEVRVKEEQSSPDPKEKQKATSEEEKEKKEREWKDLTEKDKYVCHGGKIQCQFCNSPIADIIVTSTTIMLQDKPFATIKDKDGKKNFNFTGLCMHPSQQKPGAPPPPCKSVISLGEWKDFSETMIGNDNALLVKSTIPCMISGQDLKIIHSGQMAELADVKPKVKRNPQIIESYWINEDGEKVEKIGPNKYGSLVIKTKDYKKSDKLTITLPLKNGNKTYTTTVNGKGIAILKKIFYYEAEHLKKEPKIIETYWRDENGEKLTSVSPGDKATLLIRTEGYETGSELKITFNKENNKVFTSGKDKIIKKVKVNSEGIALLKNHDIWT